MHHMPMPLNLRDEQVAALKETATRLGRTEADHITAKTREGRYIAASIDADLLAATEHLLPDDRGG